MSDSRTQAAVRSELIGLSRVLDAIEESDNPWSDFFARLREVELTAQLLQSEVRDPLLMCLRLAEHYAERGHVSLARHALHRAEESLP